MQWHLCAQTNLGDSRFGIVKNKGVAEDRDAQLPLIQAPLGRQASGASSSRMVILNLTLTPWPRSIIGS